MMKAKSAAAERKRGGQPSSSRSTTRPLKGKKLFLHLQGYRGAARVEQDLSVLGGTIEKCFSRDVDYVITSQGAPSDYEKKTRAAMTNPRPVTPSPFNLANMGIDSPHGNSPSNFEPKKPLTRGKAMAQAAKSTKLYGTMDVIEAARTWNLKIIHLDRALNWIKKELERIPDAARKKPVDTVKREMKVKKLRGTYVKVEASSCGFRPVYQELKNMPEIHLDSPPWTCPFNKGKQTSRIDERGEGEEERDPQGMPDELLALDEDSPGAAAKKGQPAKEKADRTEELFGSPILTAGEVRHMMQERKRAELKKGYCEMCGAKYDNIDQHVRNNRHRDFVTNNNNYISLDRVINAGPNMTQFLDDLTNRAAAESVFDTSLDEVLLLKEFPTPPTNAKVPATTPVKGKSGSRQQCVPSKVAAANVKDKKMPMKKKTPTKPVPALSRRSPFRKNPDRGTPSVSTLQTQQITPRMQKTRKPLERGTQSPAEPLGQTPKALETKGFGEATKNSPAKRQRTPSKRIAKASHDDKEEPETHVKPGSIDQTCTVRRGRRAAGLQESPIEADYHKPANIEVEPNKAPKKDSVSKVEAAKQVPSTPERTTSLKDDPKALTPESKPDGVRRRRSARLSQDESQETEEDTFKENEEQPVEGEELGGDNQPGESLKASQTESQKTDKEQSYGGDEAVSHRNQYRGLRLRNYEDATPRTTDAFKCMINKESEVRVLCSRLNMQEVKQCQDSETASVSVSSLLGYNKAESQEETDSGPVRRVRSSRRSRSRTNSQSTYSIMSQSIGTASQSTEPESERQSRSRSRQRLAEPCEESTIGDEAKTDVKSNETSNNPGDNEEKENIRHGRSRVSRSEIKSKELTKSPTGNKPSTPKKPSHNRSRGILTPTDMSTLTQSGGSRRKIRLRKKWSVTTDRSMRKILHSGSDDDFEGFTDDSNIPSDTSYKEVSEVELEENSEVEWVISGSSDDPGDTQVGVISHGLDRSMSSPRPDSTGITPIKHIVNNVSQGMSEASSTGWDDNLEEFLDGQVKQKTKDEKNTSGVYTSLLVQVGSPRRSPRKTPRKSPFKFVESPLSKVTPQRVASPVRRSPRKQTPQTANRTLDFNSPNFSILSGDYEDLWVGPTKNETHNLSYTQKVREGKRATPGQRTPIYQQGRPTSQMTPGLARHLAFSSSQSPGTSSSKSSSKLTLSKSKSPEKSTKPSTSSSGLQADTAKQGSTQTCKATAKPASECQPTTPKVRRQVDEEVEFYMSSPSTQIEDTLKKMSVPSPITPMEKKGKPKRLLSGKFDELPGEPTKKRTPDVYDWDESEESEAPQKKIFKSLSSTKKQVSLGHMKTFEFKAGSSLRHKTPESATKSASKTPDVRLSNLGRNVTPLAKSRSPVSSKRENSLSKVNRPLNTVTEETSASSSTVKSASSAVVQKVSTKKLPQSQPITPKFRSSRRLQTSTPTTPSVSGVMVKMTKDTPVTRNIWDVLGSPLPDMTSKPIKNISGERTPTASTASTPKTPACDKLDKLLSLHSLENIQFSPRRKSSNVASIVRFHYDTDSDDEEADQSSKPTTPMGSKPLTPKVASKKEPSKLSRSAPSERRSSSRRNVKNPSPGGKRLSPLNKSADKVIDWSKAKVKSPRRTVSRLPHTTWTKTKRVDWSSRPKHSRTSSASRLIKRLSLTNANDKRAKSASNSGKRPLRSMSISPLRKRLCMEATPYRNSLRLKQTSSTRDASTSQRDKLERNAKKAVDYNEALV